MHTSLQGTLKPSNTRHSPSLVTPQHSSLPNTRHSPTLVTPQHSSLPDTPHSPTLLTPQHSSLLNTPHSSTLLTPQHSSHPNTPHSPTLLTPQHSSLHICQVCSISLHCLLCRRHNTCEVARRGRQHSWIRLHQCILPYRKFYRSLMFVLILCKW